MTYITGRPPEDKVIYKIRIWRPKTQDSSSVYRTSEDSAYAYAAKHKRDGTLLYFAKYTLEEVIDK